MFKIDNYKFCKDDGIVTGISSAHNSPKLHRTHSKLGSRKRNRLQPETELYKAPGGKPVQEEILDRITRFQQKQKKVCNV